MDDLKGLGKLMKDNPVIIAVTLAAMIAGTILGVIAYRHGWLG